MYVDRVLEASLALARRVDRAEIDFCALAGAVGSTNGVDSIDVGGGRALFGRPGSPLNKVLGMGLDGPVSDLDLGRVEAFYAARGAPAQIELCPLAVPDLAPRLSARGFAVQGFENELARAVGPGARGGFPRPEGVRVEPVAPDGIDLWIRVTAEGFAAPDPPVGGGHAGEAPGLETMIEMMSEFAHPDIRQYLAWIDDRPAGGGAAWARDGVLGIFGTATLEAYRRRGVQRALVLASLDRAPADVDLAIATTAPGSPSQRTFERLGFQVLYTRAIFVKA